MKEALGGAGDLSSPYTYQMNHVNKSNTTQKKTINLDSLTGESYDTSGREMLPIYHNLLMKLREKGPTRRRSVLP